MNTCVISNLLAASLLFTIGCRQPGTNQKTITLTQNAHQIELHNGKIRLVIKTDSSVLTQTYYTRARGDWKEIAAAFSGPGDQGSATLPLYKRGVLSPDGKNADPYRLMTNDAFTTVKPGEQTNDTVSLILTGVINGHPIEQTITLARDDDHFHFEIDATLDKSPKLEYLLSALTFNVPGDPDFIFVPAVKRDSADLIGDRKFYAPAAILEKDGLMLAMVPDLNAINKHIVYAKGARPQKHPRIFAVPIDTNKISMPTGLDLDLHPGITTRPLISYGFIDYWTEQHVYWRHEDGNQIRDLSDNNLRYGFDLFLDTTTQKGRGYQRIAGYLWEKYGHYYFQQPRPQVMPFSAYAGICYPAAFAYEGYDVIRSADHPWPSITQRHDHPELTSWQQWVDHGTPKGGLRLSAPQWYQFIYNTAWWNNVCDATGIYYWGKKSNDTTLIEKARRQINFTLGAPQHDGIFPSLYDVGKKTWIKSLWTLPGKNYDRNRADRYFDWTKGVYQTCSASVTAGYLLLYRKTCEDNPAIIPYVRRYADFLLAHLQPNGCVPAWFDENGESLPSMTWNADGGVHIWVLSELYKATNDTKYLDAAKKMAAFMTREVMPREKWADFETFYSCAVKPETFFDKYTGQYPANTMSVYWAIDGFASLYEATHDQSDLDAAQACADYSIFYQAVWAPHYIVTAYPFGGFSSQNSDDEWLDQRSNRFASALVRTGLLSQRQDLVERGIAAARASLTLVNTPASVQNDVYKYPNFPLGLGPENIDHEGFPQMPLRSGPSWCETGGLSATAQIMQQLGGAFVDFEKHIAAGVDGVSITNYSADGPNIRISIRSQLAALPFPYPNPYTIELHLVGLAKKRYTLTVNNGPKQELTQTELTHIPLTVYPDGQIKLKG